MLLCAIFLTNWCQGKIVNHRKVRENENFILGCHINHLFVQIWELLCKKYGGLWVNSLNVFFTVKKYGGLWVNSLNVFFTVKKYGGLWVNSLNVFFTVKKYGGLWVNSLNVFFTVKKYGGLWVNSLNVFFTVKKYGGLWVNSLNVFFTVLFVTQCYNFIYIRSLEGHVSRCKKWLYLNKFWKSIE